MKKINYLLFISLLCFKGFSQSSTILPNQGVAVPQFTTVFINGMTTQPKGTVVFDKDLNVMKYWNGTAWVNLTTGGSGVGWQVNGNDISNTNTGNVGIGTTSPNHKLDVSGNASVNGTTNITPIISNASDDGAFKVYSPMTGNAFSGYQFISFDKETIQARKSGISPNFIKSEQNLKLNPFGGNVGIGTNFTPEYKLHVYSTGEQLIKVDGTNSIVAFHDRTTNAQYGFFRTWSQNPFNPAGYYGFEIGTPPISGGDPAKRLMFSTNYTLRMVIMEDGKVGIGTINPNYNLDVIGSAAFKGITHTSHFYFGGNEDTFIRGGKDGSNVVINDVPNGKVGIGRFPTVYKLEVNGTMKANEVIVETGWADYVFDKNFKLKPLSEVARFIKENKHLPDVPSAEEIQKNGAKLAELTTKMMQKIEELTLYVIEQNTEIEQLKKQIKLLK